MPMNVLLVFKPKVRDYARADACTPASIMSSRSGWRTTRTGHGASNDLLGHAADQNMRRVIAAVSSHHDEIDFGDCAYRSMASDGESNFSITARALNTSFFHVFAFRHAWQ